LLISLTMATAAGAQETLASPERLPAAEVMQLFDAYAVVQAQEALGLDNAQYGAFVTGYKALLETRRRHREQRTRLLAEVARMVRGRAPADEDRIRDRLRAVRELDTKAAAETALAVEAVEQPLTLVQRARFLVFEEQMERRKLELLSRARTGRQLRRGMQP
jgi:hypothetical protein